MTNTFTFQEHRRKERAIAKISFQQHLSPRSKTTYHILRALELNANHRPHDGGQPVTASYSVEKVEQVVSGAAFGKEWIPLQYSCLENPMDGGAWWAAVRGIAKSQTRLSDFTFTFHFHALEKEIATHSIVLAWRIPGAGEPGGLPSMGSHRVGHD